MENSSSLVQELISKWGLSNTTVYRNPSAPLIYELAMSQSTSDDPTVRPDSINSTGALVAYSGKKCGYYIFITIIVVFQRIRE